MEEKLLQVLKIANSLNEKQDKVYAQITYTADNYKSLEISIRSKKDFSFIEKCNLQMTNNSNFKLHTIIQLLQQYDGGANNE